MKVGEAGTCWGVGTQRAESVWGDTGTCKRMEGWGVVMVMEAKTQRRELSRWVWKHGPQGENGNTQTQASRQGKRGAHRAPGIWGREECDGVHTFREGEEWRVRER